MSNQELSEQTVSSSEQPVSAYEQIGGAESVKEAVRRLYEYLLSDPELRGYFVGVDLPQLKAHMAMLLSQVLGGPGGYDVGRLTPAHQRLNISAAHFRRVVLYVTGVLWELRVPLAIILDVGAILASVEGLIVNEPPTEMAA